MATMGKAGDAGVAPSEFERVDHIRFYAGRDTTRHDPVCFAGRDAEMDRLARRYHHAVSGRNGTITTICGIPGAGKTALAHRFCEYAAENLGAVVAVAPSEALSSPRSLAQRIAAAQSTVEGAAPHENGGAPVRKKHTFSVGGFKTFYEHVRESEGLSPTEKDAVEFDNELRRAGARPDVGVVLLVDEAQTAEFEQTRALRVIHLGDCRAPVFPLLVGLRHLRDAFADASLTRLDPGGQIDLGPMPINGAKECIAGSCRWFGIEWITSRRLADVLAPPTGGFAAHIDAAIAGVALVMERNGFALPNAVEAECAAEARTFRKDYYERRIRSSKATPRAFFRVLAQAVIDPSTGQPRKRGGEPFAFAEEEVERECEEVIAEIARKRPLTFGDATFESCLRAADRAGVLEHDAHSMEIRFPAAPSMARHILDLPEIGAEPG